MSEVVAPAGLSTMPTTPTVGPPLWLLAEITYSCPLHCVFCYNPVDYTQSGPELSTEEWFKVLQDARAAGSVQCGFSGGEPLVRDDLELLVAEAHRLGFYTNLLTSGIGFTPERAKALKEAGLDHVQLSFQAYLSHPTSLWDEFAHYPYSLFPLKKSSSC